MRVIWSSDGFRFDSVGMLIGFPSLSAKGPPAHCMSIFQLRSNKHRLGIGQGGQRGMETGRVNGRYDVVIMTGWRSLVVVFVRRWWCFTKQDGKNTGSSLVRMVGAVKNKRKQVKDELSGENYISMRQRNEAETFDNES